MPKNPKRIVVRDRRRYRPITPDYYAFARYFSTMFDGTKTISEVRDRFFVFVNSDEIWAAIEGLYDMSKHKEMASRHLEKTVRLRFSRL